jgi:hypothetical protein
MFILEFSGNERTIGSIGWEGLGTGVCFYIALVKSNRVKYTIEHREN